MQLMSSLSAFHHQRQLAVIGKIAIVVESRDLQRPQLHLAGVEILVGRNPWGWKVVAVTEMHAGDGAGRGVDRAQVNGLPEGEVVGVEEALLAVGQNAVAQDLQQRLLDVALKVVGIDADRERDLQRDVLRRVEFEVLTGEAVALEPALEGCARDAGVRFPPPYGFGRDEDRVPAPGPAERRRPRDRPAD